MSSDWQLKIFVDFDQNSHSGGSRGAELKATMGRRGPPSVQSLEGGAVRCIHMSVVGETCSRPPKNGPVLNDG